MIQQPEHNMDWRWRDADTGRLAQVLEEWRRTPYKDGQCVKQMGCNCVFFAVGVLDELYGMNHKERVPRMNVEQTLYDRRKAYVVIKSMMDGWYGADVVRDGVIEPGDLLVTRGTNSNVGPKNPGHLMVASTMPGIVFECSRNLGVYSGHLHLKRPVIRIFRPRRKDLWS